jgi:hypothetical protein
MAEAEQAEPQEKKRGKGKLLAFLAIIGAVVAYFAFWRRRGGSEDDED